MKARARRRDGRGSTDGWGARSGGVLHGGAQAARTVWRRPARGGSSPTEGGPAAQQRGRRCTR